MSEEKKEGLGHLCTTLQVYLGEENCNLSELPSGLDPISLLARVSVLSLSSPGVRRGHALRGTGRHTGSHAVLRVVSVCHECVDTYRAARSPAVNTCCYFLSFLLKAGIKLFIEAKLSHFMFKVEFKFNFQEIDQNVSIQFNGIIKVVKWTLR